MKGLGIDLCGVGRIERTMNEAFLQRYFTEEERAYIESRGKMGAESAAAMFAAKEAFLKAIGTGIGAGIALCDVGVSHLPGGRPVYVLTGAAKQKMNEIGAQHAFLSLTHEADTAAAVCVLE